MVLISVISLFFGCAKGVVEPSQETAPTIAIATDVSGDFENLFVDHLKGKGYRAVIVGSSGQGSAVWADKLRTIDASNPDADVVMLVNVEAERYSQVAGGFRWEVNASLSIQGDVSGEQRIQQVEFMTPIVLQYQHQSENEAIEAAIIAIGRRAITSIEQLSR